MKATDARADFPRALRFADRHRCAGSPSPEIVVVSDGALGEAADAAGPVHLGDDQARVRARSASARATSAITAVLGAPLPARQEPLRGDARGHQHQRRARGHRALAPRRRSARRPHASCARTRGERFRASTRTSPAPTARSRRRSRCADGAHDDLPADDHAYALLPERRRARVLGRHAGNTYLEAALLLDEYLDVTTVAPAEVPAPAGALRRHHLRRRRAARGAPQRQRCSTSNPQRPTARRSRSASRSRRRPSASTARRARARSSAAPRSTTSTSRAAHKLNAEPGDKVVGASDKGPLLVTGAPRRLQVRRARLRHRATAICRCAWRGRSSCSTPSTGSSRRTPAYISTLPHRRRVARPASPPRRHEARSKLPDGDRARGSSDRRTGAPCSSGSDAASTSSRTRAPKARASHVECSPRTSPTPKRARSSRRQSSRSTARAPARSSGFHIGVRREMWIYLLLAVARVVDRLEWITYHRRITV